jgi:hypothetical protein
VAGRWLWKWILLVLFAARSVAAQPLFVESHDLAGLGGEIYDMLNDHGLGINWIDYNRDTWPDLFVVNGKDSRPHLFRNDGNGTFTKVDELLPDLPNVEMMGSVFADLDNDGDEDLYVFTDYPTQNGNIRGAPPNLLLENRWADNGGLVLPGQKLFVERAVEAGVDDLLPAPGADGPAYRAVTGALFDYDRDGNVDVFVCHWLGFSEAEGHADLRDRLYRNNGDGTFQDVTTSSGLDLGTDPTTRRPCLAASAPHLDGDLWPDLWVGNIHLPLPYQLAQVYQNQGDDGSSCADDHCLLDRTLDSPGVGDDSGAAMGVAVGDIELDGDWDVYISDIYDAGYDAGATPLGNPLYLNTGVGFVFQDNSAAAAGVPAYSSWGVNFFDADQDGYEDLYVGVTGENRPDFFYHNNQDGTFTDIARTAGFFGSTEDTRGSAVADFDHDGDLDLAAVNDGGPLQLFRNVTLSAGHWLQIRLVGTESNVSALGAVVKASAGGRQLMRQVVGGSSAHSEDDLVLHFGLGDATVVDHLQILWPSGRTLDLFDQPVDGSLTLVEDGAGNQAPVLAITAPVGGTAVDKDATVTFTGMAHDAEDGDLTAGLSWTSDVDGVIGSGASFSISTLSEGTHIITAEVSDIGGMSGAYMTTLIVGNATPWVTISSPVDGASFFEGEAVEIAGTATDLEDGDLSPSLSWTSDLEGAIGSGGAISTILSPGPHVLTASVVDSGGLGATKAVSLTVTPRTTVLASGTKLVVTQKKSGPQGLSMLAKDTATVVSPPCEVDGELVIEAIGAGTPATTFPLPANLWKPIKAQKPELGCKYGPGDIVKKVLLKQGKMLKVNAAGSDLIRLASDDPRPVRIELRHGTTRHCVEFGPGNGSLKPRKKLVAKQTGPATACPNGS